MNNIQKKLVQGVFKIWEAAQKDGERFHVQDIPDVGLVAASSHVIIRLPKDCPHPFRADKEEGRIADVMKDYLTGKDSVTAFDTGDMSTFGRNLVAKKIAYGTDGKSVFVGKYLFAFTPPSVDHLDLYKGSLIRIYVEGEELPVAGLTVYRNLGDK
nr:MAG TPA: hypothetical protein [Caudoviricetes sp.]